MANVLIMKMLWPLLHMYMNTSLGHLVIMTIYAMAIATYEHVPYTFSDHNYICNGTFCI